MKGVGIGGLFTIGAGTNPIRISIEAAPWAIKTATVIHQITTPMMPMGLLTSWVILGRMSTR